jgi:hypothetical protein
VTALIVAIVVAGNEIGHPTRAVDSWIASLDPWSGLAFIVFDPGFTQRLRALQNVYLARSELLDLDAWRRRPPWSRFAENTFRLLGPLL